jgi:hypothetical protein
MPIRLPADLSDRLVAPEAFHVLNDLLGPQLSAAERQANSGLFADTLGGEVDDEQRYQQVASRYYEDYDSTALRDHVVNDLKNVDSEGWDALNGAVVDAIQAVIGDASTSMLLTMQMVDEGPDDPGDSVEVRTHQVGNVHLVRWIIGPVWIERLRLGIDDIILGKFMKVDVLEHLFHGLDGPPTAD